MTDNQDYDEMILVAANRSMVALKDGRVGTLTYWARKGEQATVIIAGRHVRVHKADVITVVVA